MADQPLETPFFPRSPRTDTEWVEFVKTTRWERAKRAKEPMRLDWEVARAYYEGFQDLDISKDGRVEVLRDRRVRSHERRVIVNRIMAYVRGMLAEYAAASAWWRFLPQGTDQRDKEAALFSEQIWEWFWNYADLEATLLDIDLQVQLFSCCFLHIGWDPNAGVEFQVPGPDGRPQTMKSGAPKWTPRSVFEIGVDPSLGHPNDFRTSHWVVDVVEDDIEAVFRETGRRVQGDSAGGLLASLGAAGKRFYRRIANTAQPSTRQLEGAEEQTNRVLRYRYYCTPGTDYETGEQYPEGLFIDIAGDTLLSKGPLPSVTGRLPFVLFYDNPVPLQFWPTTSVIQLVPLQDELNDVRSRNASWYELMVKPRVWGRKGAIAEKDKNKLNRAGAYIPYNAPQPPAWDRPPGTPPDMHQFGLQIEADMQWVGGYSASSHGFTPSGVRTASQEFKHIERDQVLRGPTHKRRAIALRQAIIETLEWIRRYMPPDVQLSFAGKDQQYAFISYQQARFPEKIDVHINPAGLQTDSKANKTEQIIELAHNGVFMLPPDMQHKMFKYAGLDALVVDVDEGEARNRRTARQENEMLLLGQPVPVLPMQDHAVHLQEHRPYMDSIEFLSYAPDIQKTFMEHVLRGHLAQLEMMMATQAAAQAEEENAQPNERAAQGEKR